VLRHGDRQAQQRGEPWQQGDLAVDPRQRDLTPREPEHPRLVDEHDGVVPPRGDDPHVVGRQSASPNGLSRLGDGHFPFRLPG
jgi:hypothetical protein